MMFVAVVAPIVSYRVTGRSVGFSACRISDSSGLIRTNNSVSRGLASFAGAGSP